MQTGYLDKKHSIACPDFQFPGESMLFVKQENMAYDHVFLDLFPRFIFSCDIHVYRQVRSWEHEEVRKARFDWMLKTFLATAQKEDGEKPSCRSFRVIFQEVWAFMWNGRCTVDHAACAHFLGQWEWAGGKHGNRDLVSWRRVLLSQTLGCIEEKCLMDLLRN